MSAAAAALNQRKAELLLRKVLVHLRYSFEKVKKLNPVTEGSSEVDLESWESFSSRFARASDLFVSRVLRGRIIAMDPAFRGSVIDVLNEGAKFGLIRDTTSWRRIRELRNIAAHEYASDDLRVIYDELVQLCPLILEVDEKLCV